MNKKAFLILLVVLMAVGAVLIGCTPTSITYWNGDIYLGDLPYDMRYTSEGSPMINTVSTESDGRVVMSYISSDGLLIAQTYNCEPDDFFYCGTLKPRGRLVWNIPTYGPIVNGVEYTDEEYKTEFCISSTEWNSEYASLYRGSISEDEKNLLEDAAEYTEVEVWFGPAYENSNIYKSYCLVPGSLNVYSAEDDLYSFWQQVDAVRYNYPTLQPSEIYTQTVP